MKLTPFIAPRAPIDLARVASLFAAACLTGCLGGGNVVTVDAQADSVTLEGGQSANLLANDTFQGQPASAGTGGNVSVALAGGQLPAGLQLADGRVTVAADTAPGSYGFSYTVCDAADNQNCATAAVQVTVRAPAIVAGADALTLALGAVGDVLANDTLGGSPASADRVTAVVDAALPTGIQLSVAGLVNVGATAAPGTYAVVYRICQTTVPANCASATATITVPALGTLRGRALSATTGAPVAGASVTVEGSNASAVTDAGGNFSIPGVPGGRRSIAFAAPGFAPTVRTADVAGGADTSVQGRLLIAGTTLPLDPAAGGTASLAGTPAQLRLAAASVLQGDGTPATGSVGVVLTPIGLASDPSLLPGDYTAQLASAVALIESFGGISVQLFDAGGNLLQLRDGVPATLRIPAVSRSASLPASAALFYFDALTGRWLPEGTAVLGGSGAARYYEGSIPRAGLWSVDAAYDTVQVSGCVVDANGVRIAGARIAAEGIDYSGTSASVTDGTGAYVLSLRKGSQATVSATAGGRASNTASIGPFAGDANLSSCLTLGQAGGGVTMKLTWGAAPADLDSYLFLPNGALVYYASRGRLDSAPFANLDVDDVSSFGPEVVTVSKLMIGTYKYAVDNFSGQGRGTIGASGARVELNVPNRALELYVPPVTGESTSTNWWHLFEFDVAADCTITVRRTNVFSTSPPSAAANGSPQYCTAP